jgi:hypothetical protein
MSNELTPEEIQALIEATAWKPPEYFVYFKKDTGEIRQIANELAADDADYIKVNYAEISAIQEGKESVVNYRVVVDFKTGEYILQNVANEGIRSFNWNDEVYHIPVTEDTSSIVLSQDMANSTWTITVSDAVLKILSKQANGINYNLSFYVTAPDDVNVLHTILKFPVKDIINQASSVIIDSSAAQRVSVFCRNVFESYSHKIS